jgi:hypothetical protein
LPAGRRGRRHGLRHRYFDRFTEILSAASRAGAKASRLAALATKKSERCAVASMSPRCGYLIVRSHSARLKSLNRQHKSALLFLVRHSSDGTVVNTDLSFWMTAHIKRILATPVPDSPNDLPCAAQACQDRKIRIWIQRPPLDLQCRKSKMFNR